MPTAAAGPSALYQIPKTERDPARLIWWGIFVWIFISISACWLTSQYMAWALNLKPVAMPWDCFFWFWDYNKQEYGEHVLSVIGRAHVLLGAGALISMFVPASLMWKQKSRVHGQRNDLYGSAHWATPDEVAATGLLPDDKNKGGVLFGAYNDGSRIQYLRHKGPEHMLVFAPTRSGKGVGIVIPTLLSWDQSVLVNDIKGENWELSSGFRQRALGQRCIRFAPADEGSARFNPLNEIRMDNKNLIKDVQNIATMIVDPDGKGLEDHWAKTGFDLLVGAILYILLEEKIRQKNLAGVAALLSDGGEIRQIAAQEAKKGRKPEDGEIDGAQAVMLYIAKVANEKLEQNQFRGDARGQAERIGWNVAAQAAGAMNNKAPNEFSGVMSTSLSFLTLYRDSVVAQNTSASDFSIEDLMGAGFDPSGKPKGPKVSLYIVSPPSDKDRIKPLTRLILNMTLRRLTEGMSYNEDGTSKSLYPHRLLLLIDEFPSLGKLDVFEEALAFIAGYGLKALLITQDLSQLQKAYTKDESIVSNCHIRIAYAPNKVETADLLSQMTGKMTVTQTQLQYSGSRLAMMLHNVNTSENTVGRELLTPDECMRLPPDDELVFMAGHSPIYCQKIKYYADQQLYERMQMRAAQSNAPQGMLA
ncbi:MAG: type IV secretory system conjugative DNA transfer family protein [Burkholderiaceae bacterium]|jgi:type IV secretion system protein VirD4|nr:type IV secretory system conjugative DNA transfer family protein [Burkholderiaceae bacterium]